MGEIPFTIVDLMIAAIVLLSAAYAAWRGLVRETLSVFSWVFAAYVTLRFFPDARPLLRAYVTPEWLADFCAVVGLFMLVLLPLGVLSRRFSDAVKRTSISSVDRGLGFVFGAARGIVIAALAYIVFSIIVPPENQPVWVTRAQLLPMVQNTSDILISMVPPSEDMPLADVLARPIGRSAADEPETPLPEQTDPQELDEQGYGVEERAALDRLIETTGAP